MTGVEAGGCVESPAGSPRRGVLSAVSWSRAISTSYRLLRLASIRSARCLALFPGTGAEYTVPTRSGEQAIGAGRVPCDIQALLAATAELEASARRASRTTAVEHGHGLLAVNLRPDTAGETVPHDSACICVSVHASQLEEARGTGSVLLDGIVRVRIARIVHPRQIRANSRPASITSTLVQAAVLIRTDHNAFGELPDLHLAITEIRPSRGGEVEHARASRSLLDLHFLEALELELRPGATLSSALAAEDGQTANSKLCDSKATG